MKSHSKDILVLSILFVVGIVSLVWIFLYVSQSGLNKDDGNNLKPYTDEEIIKIIETQGNSTSKNYSEKEIQTIIKSSGTSSVGRQYTEEEQRAIIKNNR